ncbi:glycoside hydrolase family 43 protein [Halobacteria archaeon AArc-m2/3/4]|uniref:Glycoside hydrolase family 43 protein n=1 Tax=Natronoglomus mannanivorans TaxID=2979990 RepID=A0ABT2QFH4_9EURY|nr:glycoside hydrolase family 43 protein [Halobacteria archaeon AArc-m2/3/4]
MHAENPILPGFHPDPSICRVGEDYFLATSSFEYFPGVPLFHSRNLVDWEPIGHALTRDDQLPLETADSSKGVFAPTLRHHDGTFYLITTNVSAGGHFVVTADDPRGEWSDPTWIDAPGIDPDLFWDDRGDGDPTVYVTYRGGPDGIEQAEVDLETGALGEPRQLCNRLEGDYTEAPHLYEIDGTYYLLVAEGGTHTKHMVSVARADDPTGPFESHPDNPVLSHRNVSGMFNPIQATGHGDLVQAHDGSWWLVFLGIRKHGGHPGWHHLGRETFLAPVEWNEGWPVVNGGEPVELDLEVDLDVETASPSPEPSADLEADSRWETRDPFAGDELGPEWNYRHNPERDRYELADGTGALVLHGSPATLEDEQPTFVGRRQQHFDCLARTRLAFDPDPDVDVDEEAGLTVLYDDSHHYDLGVVRRGDDGERRAIVRQRVGDIEEITAETALPDGPVDLVCEATTETYRFALESAVDSAEPERETLTTAPTKYLATEVAGGFTGVYVGLYATGHGEPCETPARFESFEYRSTESEAKAEGEMEATTE